VNDRKIHLETLLLKSGRRIGEICEAAGIGPRMMYEFRHRKYQKPPRTTAIAKVARVLGVSEDRFLRLVCANSPASRLLPPLADDAAAAVG
jgi:hypothetical protein